MTVMMTQAARLCRLAGNETETNAVDIGY